MGAEIWDFCKRSATHLWANIVILMGGLLASWDLIIPYVADFAGDPDFKAQLSGIIPAKAWPYVVIAIMAVTKLARNRTMGK